MSATELRGALTKRWVVVAGDSIARFFFAAMLRLLSDDGEEHKKPMHETLLFSHTSVAELPGSLAERWVVVAGDSIAYPFLQRCFAFFQMMVWTNVCACTRRHLLLQLT